MSAERLTCQEHVRHWADLPDVRNAAEGLMRERFLREAKRGDVVWPSVVATVTDEPECIQFRVTGLVDCR